MSFRLKNTSDLERLLVRAERAAIALDVEEMHACASLLNDAMQSLSSLSPIERQCFRKTLLRYRDMCTFINETLEQILSQSRKGFRENSGYGQSGLLKADRGAPAMMMEGYS